MTRSIIQNSFVAGEVSPQLYGRTDLAKFRNGASTCRNMFVNYRGGASSRAGGKYVGTCLQTGSSENPPRLIPFQFNINQGYALEFGDQDVVRAVSGTADNGGEVRLTLTTTRGLMTGNTMVVSGVGGTTEANGTWPITVDSATTVTLVGTTYANAYTSGGSTSTVAGYMRIVSNGEYVIEAEKIITAITQANPGVFSVTSHGWAVGDWVYIADCGGMTEFNGLMWVIDTVPSANTFTVKNLFGDQIATTSYSAYTTGGTAARIYTIVSPYASEDLPYLKFTQSADTMSFTCINQETDTEYPPYDLTRAGATSWLFSEVTFESSIAAPANLVVTAHPSAALSTYYSYVVTAVDADTGDESVASTPDEVQNNDISVNAGSNSMTWDSVATAGSYNVYRATPLYGASVPSGVLYGFVGASDGVNFVDTNIIADFTKTPPINYNPFDGAGNYPGCVAYYQQRRVYANTLNNPDTYFMSRPGSYTNFDTSSAVTDNDSIIGAPWAQQINGIQFMVPMNPGLVILTGNGAWLLNGGNNATITPSNQTATSQAYNGSHSNVMPIVINYNMLYVQTKGSIVRDLTFNFFQNVFTGSDLTILSSHLFNYHQINQWAYAEEPYKLVWAVRDDGTMLSLTYLKEQDVYGWARHDTNGFYVSVCSVTEPPVDAVYTIVQRYINGHWMYYTERFDNRNWQTAEDAFCVDAGLSYPVSYPDATLTPAAADGTQNISSVTIINGGSGYTNPTIEAVDPTGEGTGATFTATVTDGVITSIAVDTEGEGYQTGTVLEVTDADGSGAVLQAIITNIVSFTASASVFSSGNVGDVIRIGNNNASVSSTGVANNGGGKAIITEYVSGTQVNANIVEPITAVIPNNPDDQPVPAISGEWSLATPTDTVSGLNHLEGMEVAIVADGSVVPNQTVEDGTITLPDDASMITIGLPFVAQLQTLYLDPPGENSPTAQGKRKNIYNVSVRCENTRGIEVGTNQPDQSTQPNNATVPWTNMKEVKERNALVSAGNAIPLFTGDFYINVPADWSTKAQVAVQQRYPLPANILAAIPNYTVGDTSG